MTMANIGAISNFCDTYSLRRFSMRANIFFKVHICSFHQKQLLKGRIFHLFLPKGKRY